MSLEFNKNLSVENARSRVNTTFNLSSLNREEGNRAAELLTKTMPSPSPRQEDAVLHATENQAAPATETTTTAAAVPKNPATVPKPKANPKERAKNNKRVLNPIEIDLEELANSFEFYQYGGKEERGTTMAEGYVVKKFRVISTPAGPKLSTSFYFTGMNTVKADIGDFSVKGNGLSIDFENGEAEMIQK